MRPTFSPRRSIRAALALAALVALVPAAVALAKVVALKVAPRAAVTNVAGTTRHEAITVTAHGFAVYTLSGDSTRHPRCTAANGCFDVWPPVTVGSARGVAVAHGVRGRLGIWHRGRTLQLMLAGHPLYRYAPDTSRDSASGEGIQSFGGTWHVVRAG